MEANKLWQSVAAGKDAAGISDLKEDSEEFKKMKEMVRRRTCAAGHMLLWVGMVDFHVSSSACAGFEGGARSTAYQPLRLEHRARIQIHHGGEGRVLLGFFNLLLLSALN